mgnify:CR=1 FL=1
MSTNTTLALGAGAALAIGIAVFVMGSSSEEPDLSARVAELEAKVARLEAERERPRRERPRELRGEGRRRGDRPMRAARAGGPPDDREVEEIARRALRRADGDPDAVLEVLDSDDPEVRDRLDALVRDSMEAEREERWERRRERIEQRVAERLDQLAQDASLNDAQVDALDTALAAEREEIFALFRQAREDGSWADARDKADAIRAATDERVAGQLDDTQRDAWDSFREEEASRRGR